MDNNESQENVEDIGTGNVDDKLDVVADEDKAVKGNDGESQLESVTASVTADEKTEMSEQSLTNKDGTNKEVFQNDEEEKRNVHRTDSHFDYGGSLLQDNIYYEKEIKVRPELIESLTDGFTEKFLPSLQRNRKTIEQIRTSQNVLMETVQQENSKFNECLALGGLETMMTRAKVYHTKLLKLRKEMTHLHEKSAKLKRRALRLQQQKQKEELTLAQRQEDEYEKEKMLRPRIAKSSPDSPPSSPST